MTNVLLLIIIVLMAVRVALQMWQFGRLAEKGYSSTFDVRKTVVTAKTAEELGKKLCDDMWWCDYDIVSIVKDKGEFYAFLSRKRIKNYYG